MFSVYFNTLQGDVKSRYLEKIKDIDNCDPYTLKDTDLCSNLKELVTVEMIDLYSYLLSTHSFYTKKELKAYKSLQAFKFFTAGFVQKIQFRKINEKYVILGEVKHSQRMSAPNLKVWIKILSDGSISTAHCTCMAGLGEVCSHVAAILFALESGLLTDETACTDKLAVWKVPKVSRKVVPAKVADIDWGRSINKKGSDANIPTLQGESLQKFLKKVEEANPTSALLSVVEPFALARKVSLDDRTPLILLNLYNESFKTYCLEDLRNVDFDLTVTEEERDFIQKSTVMQNKNKTWYKVKSGRVTASNFKGVCRTSVDKPSISLIKAICYPQAILFQPKQLKYGIEHEEIARCEYAATGVKNHENFTLEKTGFIISLDHPEIGATPDGLVTCDCCGSGCLEIKCPFVLKTNDFDIEKFSEMKGSCLCKDGDEYTLIKTHNYYYQIQLQMYVSKLTYCDFVVWCKRFLFVERIFYNSEFCEENVQIALHFHKNVIIPELMSRWYTQQTQLSSSTEQLWCDCQEPEDDKEMLRCANVDCPIQWYHLECVNLAAVPTLYWFCKTCSPALLNMINLNAIG